ncbi:glycosyltransferase family 2 protein [Peribacillus frigoritolerans]|uniref:Glycosyltransferase family 2 protein n=1 Tax=Peribacillus frigoritolerans TaxID=450367 RepID=A0AAJ1QQE4_9BACI|nr:glycosyltransferase family 2 protein [Peribacillus frigoritolerans]MDM5285513.1 glycosyltransferase family 2 protein [Peribacillus frigoritolerans]
MDIKVSIIVPVYNCERYLPNCIESILKQSYTNIELVLVDDGSQDASRVVCEKYEISDSRIKAIYQQNSGASTARNVGMSLSTGKYLMFVDADDFIESRMVENLVEIAEKEDADIVISGITVDTFSDDKEELVSSKENICFPRTIVGNKNIPFSILDLIESEKINGPCAKLFKMDILKKENIKMPPHLSLQEDLYFNLKFLEHVNILCVTNKSYYHYTKGLKESLTTSYFSNKYEMTNEVHDLLLEYYTMRCQDVNTLKRIKFIYIKNTIAAFMNFFHAKCELSKLEKMNQIKRIIKSPKFNSMLAEADRKGIKYRILKSILKTKSSILIYCISNIIYIMKYKFKMRY